MLLSQHLGEYSYVHRRPLLLLTRSPMTGRSSCACAAFAPPVSQLRRTREDLLSKRRSACELAEEQLQHLHGPQDQIQSFLALNDPDRVSTCIHSQSIEVLQ